MSKVRFSFLTGDVNWSEHSGKWISQRFSDEDGNDFYLVRELTNMYDACGNDAKSKYYCTLSIIIPTKYQDFDKAFECCGWDEIDKESLSDREKVEIIHSYAGHSYQHHQWDNSGNNYSKLFKECQDEAESLIEGWE